MTALRFQPRWFIASNARSNLDPRVPLCDRPHARVLLSQTVFDSDGLRALAADLIAAADARDEDEALYLSGLW